MSNREKLFLSQFEIQVLSFACKQDYQILFKAKNWPPPPRDECLMQFLSFFIVVHKKVSCGPVRMGIRILFCLWYDP